MARRIISIDVNHVGGPLFYNISSFTDRTRLVIPEQAVGQVTDFSIWVIGELNGNLCPGMPDVGWEIMDYDKDYYGPNLHRYNAWGIVVFPTGTPTPGTFWQEIQVEGVQRQMQMPVPLLEFDQATYPTEGSRVTALIEAGLASFGLRGSWDDVTNVEMGNISYPAGSTTSYDHDNLYNILEQIRVDPGQSTDLHYPMPARFWYVQGIWQDETNPETLGVQRVLYYYSSTQVAREPVPLTDRSDGMAYYAYDSFTKADSATTMGTAETGQDWAPLLGVWGISSNQAYQVTNVAGQECVVVDASVADCEVQVTFTAIDDTQRLAFRVVSNISWSYKWEGLVFEKTSAGAYLLRKYQGDVFTTLQTYAETPLNGDVIKVVLSGSTITVYINGVAHTPVTNSFNQTATLHGISSSSVTLARWDNFSVWAKGATYSGLTFPKDATRMTNILPIEGPLADPTPINWQNLVGTQGATDGDLTKTLKPDAWQPSHTYSTSDFVTPTDQDGGEFELTSGGGNSGSSEPAWNNTEGATTADNGLTWTRRNWNSGATSKQMVTDDGGYVAAVVEQVWKVQDSFNRSNNTATMGKAPSGQNWTTLGTNAVWGILNGQAYPVSGTNPIYAAIDAGVSTCIVEVKLAVLALSQRILFRARDAANLWYLENIVGAYKLYKRVAGTDTLMATVSVSPAQGDILKVSLEGDVIKFYLNGVFKTSVTDAFNMGATLHGFGINGPTSARFDDFSVRQTDETMAFGLGLNANVTSYVDIDFGWRLIDTRQAQAVESGVLVGSPFTYSEGDTFKVSIRPYQQGQSVIYLVQYYHNNALHYNSTQHPTPTEAAPYYAQGAIYDRGATISNVVMRRYTYGIYQDDDSVGTYGPFPANKTLKREDLDTQAKRVAYKNAFFSRHAQPKAPASLTTLQPYTAGRLILINNSRFQWVNRLALAVTVTKDWGQSGSGNLHKPEYQIVLGDSEVEWGDDEPAGFMLKNSLNEKSEPHYPENFAAHDGDPEYGTWTVNERFTWDEREGDRYVEIQIRPVGGDPLPIRQFPALPGEVVTGGLQPDLAYTARIRAVSYGDQRSDWSPAVQFQTVDIPRLPAPGSLTETSNVYDFGRGVALVSWSWTAPSDPGGLGIDGYRVTLWQNGIGASTVLGVVLAYEAALLPGDDYIFTVQAIDGHDRPGDAATITGTAADVPAPPHVPVVVSVGQTHQLPNNYYIMATVTKFDNSVPGDDATGGGVVRLHDTVNDQFWDFDVPGTQTYPYTLTMLVSAVPGFTYGVSFEIINQWGQHSGFTAETLYTVNLEANEPPTIPAITSVRYGPDLYHAIVTIDKTHSWNDYSGGGFVEVERTSDGMMAAAAIPVNATFPVDVMVFYGWHAGDGIHARADCINQFGEHSGYCAWTTPDYVVATQAPSAPTISVYQQTRDGDFYYVDIEVQKGSPGDDCSGVGEVYTQINGGGTVGETIPANITFPVYIRTGPFYVNSALIFTAFVADVYESHSPLSSPLSYTVYPDPFIFNDIPNPGFEDIGPSDSPGLPPPVDPRYWNQDNGGGGASSRDTTEFYSGTASAKLTVSGVGQQGGYVCDQFVIGSGITTDYNIRLKAKSSSGSGKTLRTVISSWTWDDVGKVFVLSLTQTLPITGVGSSWAVYNKPWTNIFASGTYLTFGIYNDQASNGNVSLYVDDVEIVPVITSPEMGAGVKTYSFFADWDGQGSALTTGKVPAKQVAVASQITAAHLYTDNGDSLTASVDIRVNASHWPTGADVVHTISMTSTDGQDDTGLSIDVPAGAWIDADLTSILTTSSTDNQLTLMVDMVKTS